MNYTMHIPKKSRRNLASRLLRLRLTVGLTKFRLIQPKNLFSVTKCLSWFNQISLLIYFIFISISENFTTWEKTSMIINSFLIIQNFKNSKPLEPLEYKKTTKFGQKKTFLKTNDYEKPKKGGKKKMATFQKSFLLFLSFVLFCLYYPLPST